MLGQALPSRRAGVVLMLVLVALLLHFSMRTAQLGLTKQYSIDEFQYAHAAWLPVDSFHAIKRASYFVAPESVLTEGRLFIDGQRIEDPIFELNKGPHEVRWEGIDEPFSILWLPRNGLRYHPDLDALPSFSVIF